MTAIEEEIGRIIASRLTAEQTVFLPGIGTLGIRRTPARRISTNRIAPPCRTVEFSSSAQGPSLVDTIARTAACTPEQAAEIYRRWLDKSRDPQSGRLEIAGVGTLFQKSFRPDSAFDRRLNPQGRSERRLRRAMPWWLWCLSTLCIVFLIAAGIFWLDPVSRWPERFSKTPAPIEMTLLNPAGDSEPASGQPVEKSENPVADTTAAPTVEAEAPAATEPAATAAAERPAPETIERTRSGWSYVVLGIFSTEENARRAIGQAVEKSDSLTEDDCRIFRYGDKFLVSLGEAETRSEAQVEAARHRRNGISDAWVYSKQ